MRYFAAKVCEHCGKEYIPTGSCQKYCSECKREMDLKRMRDRHKKTYVKKGYNQSGVNNNNWKGGIRNYRKILPIDGSCCEICGSKNNLLVHHRDHNRYNNDKSNLAVWCKKCHQEHHCKRDSSGKFTTHS